MFEFERSAVGRCYFSTISFGSDDALTIRLDTCASRSVIAINKFSESVRNDIRDRLEKALNDGSVNIWKSKVANGTGMDTYLCSINDVTLAGVTMKKFYFWLSLAEASDVAVIGYDIIDEISLTHNIHGAFYSSAGFSEDDYIRSYNGFKSIDLTAVFKELSV